MTRSEFRRRVKESRLTISSDKEGLKVTAEVTKEEVASKDDVPVVSETAEEVASDTDASVAEIAAQVGSSDKEVLKHDGK